MKHDRATRRCWKPAYYRIAPIGESFERDKVDKEQVKSKKTPT
jgi:hypothetical protein